MGRGKILTEPTGQATTQVLYTASHSPQGFLETQRALFTLENLLTEEAQARLEALALLTCVPLFTALVTPGSPGLALNAGLAFRCQLLSIISTYPCVQENNWLWQCITDGFPSQYYAGSLALWVKIYDVFNKIWDVSALESWKMSTSRQKYLILTRHPEG